MTALTSKGPRELKAAISSVLNQLANLPDDKKIIADGRIDDKEIDDYLNKPSNVANKSPLQALEDLKNSLSLPNGGVKAKLDGRIKLLQAQNDASVAAVKQAADEARRRGDEAAARAMEEEAAAAKREKRKAVLKDIAIQGGTGGLSTQAKALDRLLNSTPAKAIGKGLGINE
jgi:hypothetical protein